MSSRVRRIDGRTAEEYGNSQTQMLDDFLGVGFDDLPKQPEREVFCVTFKTGPLAPYYLEVKAVDHVAVREYCLAHFPQDVFHSYPRELFESLYPERATMKKLGEVVI